MVKLAGVGHFRSIDKRLRLSLGNCQRDS